MAKSKTTGQSINLVSSVMRGHEQFTAKRATPLAQALYFRICCMMNDLGCWSKEYVNRETGLNQPAPLETSIQALANLMHERTDRVRKALVELVSFNETSPLLAAEVVPYTSRERPVNVPSTSRECPVDVLSTSYTCLVNVPYTSCIRLIIRPKWRQINIDFPQTCKQSLNACKQSYKTCKHADNDSQNDDLLVSKKSTSLEEKSTSSPGVTGVTTQPDTSLPNPQSAAEFAPVETQSETLAPNHKTEAKSEVVERQSAKVVPIPTVAAKSAAVKGEREREKERVMAELSNLKRTYTERLGQEWWDETAEYIEERHNCNLDTGQGIPDLLTLEDIADTIEQLTPEGQEKLEEMFDELCDDPDLWG